MQRNFTQFSFIYIKKALASRTSCLVANAFVFGQEIPQPNLKYNINSPNFFITNFNDMKRMNLIRAALFAVFAFMGTLSLSAQGWLPAQQAIVVINAELELLSEPPVPVAGNNGTISKQQNSDKYAKSGLGCSDCQLHAVKTAFLELSLLRIKQGMDTGDAVNEVRALMISGSGNNLAMLNTIQTAYVFMELIL